MGSADLEAELLGAALTFARSRLDPLLGSLVTDGTSLLLHAFPSATAQELAAVAASGADGDLAAARSKLADFTTKVAAGIDNLGLAEAALADLAAALSALLAAAGKVAPESTARTEEVVTSVVLAAVRQGGDAISGLAADLGLTGSIADHLTVSAGSLAFDVTVSPAHQLGLLTLSETSLRAALAYGTSPASLGLTLSTTAQIGLAVDGFVEQLLGGAASVRTALAVTVDTATGLSFQAGAKGRVELPGSLSIPGVQLHGLGIEVPPDQHQAIALTGTLAGSLGPIKAVVHDAGILLALDAGRFTVAAKLPIGAGLTVDAGVVRGGGYLQAKDHEYGGALDLSLGPIEITAFGLVGTDPFSLVLVLSVRFSPPIQLSFGFTLNAVGGLLALERTIATDVLRAGLHDHTADELLFPKDPVGAAPTLLDQLRATFPAQQGGFVVGPLLELGWGAPVSFVRARLGVLIALPDPKVILIGSLRVALPLPEAPLVDLRADVYVEITPDHLLFMVSLSGSMLVGFSLAGDFGMLIAWGDQPELALSAGGFHPHFIPPGELAGMRRVSVDVSPPVFLTLRAEAYLALTSNSFQLGARVELRAEVAGVGAEGHLQFDALVRFSPFHFEIDLSAGVSLFAFGESFASVDLHLHLEGPGPWVAEGTASLSLLFFDVDLDIPRISWGSGPLTPPDVAPVQKLVHEALSLPAAWEARLPPDADVLVRLAHLPDGLTVVHPLGALEARQHVVPLETVIDRLGADTVDVPRVNLGGPTVDGLGASALSHTTDLFAPGSFLNLTDDQKLCRPAFEPFPSGVVLAASPTLVGSASETAYRWDTITPGHTAPRKRQDWTLLTGVHAALFASGPAGKGFALAENPYAAALSPVMITPAHQVTVVSTRDLTPLAGAMTTTAAARVVADLPVGSAQWAGAGVGA